MAARQIPYTRTQLLSRDPIPPLTGRKLDEVAFPLGGIGTGSISLGGWGQLRDWEIRNRPAKGYVMPQGFFTLRADTGKQSVTKVLQGPVGGTYTGDGHTVPWPAGEGLPHFRNCSFDGRYPIANVKLSDPAVPLDVELEAFNPFIPLNDKDSGIPVAILTYRLRNPGKRAVRATIFGNLTNIVGEGREAEPVSAKKTSRGLTGLVLSAKQAGKPAPDLGSLVLATTCDDVSVWTNWQDDRISKFWEAVAWSDKFPPRKGRSRTGTVAARCTVKPGQTVAVTFLIAWYFPIFEHWRKPECGDAPSWRNYYATLWRDAWDAAGYTAQNLDRLAAETKLFRDTLFASTLPTVVLDAVSSQISILKTPTCLRLEDGTFYGFEGCSNTVGCCEGSCTHVWNYAQALPYLFPPLQRSVRDAEWANSMQDDGYVTFRMPLPLGTKAKPDFHPAADGQMGTVMQAYREWLISGDDEWLKHTWPQAKRALEFAWRYWDADRDGVMEGLQHNTYDMEFYGANTMMGSLYLGALRAGEEMAKVVGDEGAAATYRDLFERGSAWTDEHLFNGEYYEQQVNPDAHLVWPERQRTLAGNHGKDDRFPSWPRWQFGKGCLSDQLLGQWYAEMLQLGYLYDRRQVRKTLQSIFRYNWRAELADHPCLLRIYALNDEAGLLIGSWPKGGRPGYAFWFADEVWCGIEYQVASHLIYEGMVEEGLAIVKGVRDRYTGERRNPWNEIECGHHYSRSLASYAVMLALAGFRYSAPAQRLGFGPRLFAEDFACFFSVGSGWGLYRQQLSRKAVAASVEVKQGSLTLSELEIDATTGEGIEARLSRRKVEASLRKRRGGVAVVFASPVTINQGETLKLTVA